MDEKEAALAAFQAAVQAGQDEETQAITAKTRQQTIPRLRAWTQRFDGADGLGCYDLPKRGLRLIHSIARENDGDIWSHVSLSRFDRVMPTWEQVRDAWLLIHPDAYGVVVISPTDKHVNIGEVAHIWGNLSRMTVPDFTHGLGTI